MSRASVRRSECKLYGVRLSRPRLKGRQILGAGVWRGFKKARVEAYWGRVRVGRRIFLCVWGRRNLRYTSHEDSMFDEEQPWVLGL